MHLRAWTLILLTFISTVSSSAQEVRQLVDYDPVLFDSPLDVAVDGNGTAYVALSRQASLWWSVVSVTPDGTATEVIGQTGPTFAGLLVTPSSLAFGPSGDLFVAGSNSSNVVKRSPDGTQTEILGPNTGGLGSQLSLPNDVAVDGAGNVYVTGSGSDNVFRITPAGSASVILDASGDGTGNTLSRPHSVCVDLAGNVYVSGNQSDNVFRIAPTGTVTEIADATSGGAAAPIDRPTGLDVDGSGNVYVACQGSNNLLRISPTQTVTQLIGPAGDGVHGFGSPEQVLVDGAGQIWATASSGTGTVFRVAPSGVVQVVLDDLAGGVGSGLSGARGLAEDSSGAVFVTGEDSDNLYRMDASGSGITELYGPGTDMKVRGLTVGRTGTVYVVGGDTGKLVRLEQDGTSDVLLDVLTPPASHPQKILTAVVDVDETVYASALLGFVFPQPSGEVARIAAGGAVTQHYDGIPTTMVLRAPGDLYVSSGESILRVDPTGGGTTSILTAQDGFHVLTASGSGYVFAARPAPYHEVFRLGLGNLPPLIDATGDGTRPLIDIAGLAAMPDTTLLVTGRTSDNVFRVDPSGVITLILDATGDGAGELLEAPGPIVVDSQGIVYVGGLVSRNVFRITPDGTVSTVMTSIGDGKGHELQQPTDLAIDGADRLYVGDRLADRVFRVDTTAWTDLGGASPPGSHGVPFLEAWGALTPGSIMDRSLTNAPPDALMLALLTFTSTPLQALGGTVHAWPFDYAWYFESDAQGAARLAVPWPIGFASGLDLTLQFLVQDLTVPAGITLSNAVRATSP